MSESKCVFHFDRNRNQNQNPIFHLLFFDYLMMSCLSQALKNCWIYFCFQKKENKNLDAIIIFELKIVDIIVMLLTEREREKWKILKLTSSIYVLIWFDWLNSELKINKNVWQFGRQQSTTITLMTKTASFSSRLIDLLIANLFLSMIDGTLYFFFLFLFLGLTSSFPEP